MQPTDKLDDYLFGKAQETYEKVLTFIETDAETQKLIARVMATMITDAAFVLATHRHDKDKAEAILEVLSSKAVYKMLDKLNALLAEEKDHATGH